MNNLNKILIGTRNIDLQDILEKTFIEDAYQCDIVDSCMDLINKVNNQYNLIIIDNDLMAASTHRDEVSALEAIKIIRVDYSIPIIMLNDSNKDFDEIAALQIGIDDYIVKPFNSMAFFLRCRNILKRTATKVNTQINTYTFDDWVLDCNKMTLSNSKGITSNLTTHLYKMLITFIDNRGIILSREQIMEKISPERYDSYDRSIDVQIGRLRKVLELDVREPKIIRTIRGSGYLFDCKVTKQKI